MEATHSSETWAPTYGVITQDIGILQNSIQKNFVL